MTTAGVGASVDGAPGEAVSTTGDKEPVTQAYAGYLTIVSAAVLWGSIGLFVRLVHTDPVTITFYRVLFGALSLAGLLAVRRKLGELAALSRRQFGHLALVAFFYAVNWVFFFAAIKLTTVAEAVLAYYTAPVFMALFGLIFLHEPLNSRAVTSVVIGFAGLAVMLSVGTGQRGSLAGILLGALGGLNYAAAVTTARPLSQRLDPLVLAFGQTVGATVFLLPAVAFTGLVPAGIGPGGWGALLVLGTAHTTVAFALFFSGIRHVTTGRVGLLMYLDPLSSVVFAGVFLGEALSIRAGIGGALIVAAGLIGLIPYRKWADRYEKRRFTKAESGAAGGRRQRISSVARRVGPGR
jgi:drug/metabolite transporter (DMT)-like permease